MIISRKPVTFLVQTGLYVTDSLDWIQMLGNEMSQQLMIVNTRDEAVIDGFVDHIHHHIFEEAEIKHHLSLLARLM
jgi:hypothetical protein